MGVNDVGNGMVEAVRRHARPYIECFIGMHCSWRLLRIRGFQQQTLSFGREKTTKEIRAKLSGRGDALNCCLGR